MFIFWSKTVFFGVRFFVVVFLFIAEFVIFSYNPQLVKATTICNGSLCCDIGNPDVVTCNDGSICTFGCLVQPTCNGSPCGDPIPGWCCDPGGGGGYDFPTCSGGTSLSCASPEVNFCINYVGTCAPIFPSKVHNSWACPATDPETGITGPARACQTNCGCCATGQSYVCQAGTHTYSYYSSNNRLNNAGTENVPVDPKSCDVGAYISSVRGACTWDGDDPPVPTCQYTSTCTNACSCVSTNSPPTGTLSCPTQIILGQTGSFNLSGSDVNGNLSSSGLYYSLTSPEHWYDNNNTDCNTSPYCPQRVACTGASCSTSASWTPPAVGSYYVTANYYDSDGAKCSGNVFHTLPYNGFYACASPLTNDYCTVNVVAAPLPTCNISAGDTSINYNTATTISWS
ncbi:MAG: hypothetical protein AAB569_04105, partial [Patescibacteria group bacterium]